MRIDDLATPALLVEQARLEENLRRMQARADAQGVALRPHTKTHKSIALARRQRALGARGLAVAKPGEAEVFVEAGFDDVRVAYAVVGRERHERLLRLMDQARVSFCVDTAEGAQAASDFYAAHGRRAGTLVEVDVGHGRCGVPWDDGESVRFARFVEGLPGLRLAGLLTHEGQAYWGPQHDGEDEAAALGRAGREARDRMLSLTQQLHEAGIEAARPGTWEISVGSTPSMTHFENDERGGFRVTEVRPGNYVFYDAMQVGLGAAAWEDCALTVLATVVSRRERAGSVRLYLDAGKKVLTSDTGYNTGGYGTLLQDAASMQTLAGARLVGLSEEHGWVEATADVPLGVGDRVRIVPNHACVVANMQRWLHVVEGDEVVHVWAVDAQGQVQ